MMGCRFVVLLALLGCFIPTVRAADPEEAHYNVVVTLYNAGQWQAAIRKIEEREKLSLPDPMRARYLHAKGLAWEKGEKNAEARAAYDELLAKYPKAPESRPARIALAHLDYAARNFDGVIKTYGAIDQNGLANADKRNLAVMFAESLYAKDDAKASREAFEKAIQLGADKNAVAGRLFDLYARLKLHNELVDLAANGVAGLDPGLVSLLRAESLLALGQHEKASAEAATVATANPYHPRASFTRGLALIKLGKLKEAVDPLTAAAQSLKDPPPPPGLFVTLADCLLESGRAKEAEPYLDRAEKMVPALPEAEREGLRKQIALVRLRQTLAAGNRKEQISAITKARDSIPQDQLSRVLYLRLFALSEEGDDDAVLETFKEDSPIFQAGAEDGSATLIYFASLRKRKRHEEALKVLGEFVGRKPAAPEAARARLELANAALQKQELAKAATQLDALVALKGAEEQLGKETFHKALFNRAVVADKLQKPDEAFRTLNQLIQVSPANPTLGQALVLLGQLHAVKNDYRAAAETWQKALAAGGVAEADVRDRLARVLFATKDFAATVEQLEAEAKLLGNPAKLGRQSLEIWARAEFATGRFTQAAARYEKLHRRYHDSSGYAYECAVAQERDGKWAEAARWYAIAQKAKDKLPPEYASAVDANLANAQLQSGATNQGAAYWIETLVPATDNPTFETAVGVMRKLATTGKLNRALQRKMEAVIAVYDPGQPRYYALGALLVQGTAAAATPADAATLAAKLAEEFAVHESELNPKTPSATLAPAIIYFFKGESERSTGRHADALASYETVLSAYPYNEWPDAAACGAAECYAALGDTKTARQKFNEVIKSSAGSTASATWGELAQRRINELAKGESP